MWEKNIVMAEEATDDNTITLPGSKQHTDIYARGEIGNRNHKNPNDSDPRR